MACAASRASSTTRSAWQPGARPYPARPSARAGFVVISSGSHASWSRLPRCAAIAVTSAWRRRSGWPYGVKGLTMLLVEIDTLTPASRSSPMRVTPRHVRRLEHVEHAEMAEAHAPLHAARERLLGDVVGGQLRGVVAGVGVEVEGHAEGLRRLEEPVDVPALIAVHVGAA